MYSRYAASFLGNDEYPLQSLHNYPHYRSFAAVDACRLWGTATGSRAVRSALDPGKAQHSHPNTCADSDIHPYTGTDGYANPGADRHAHTDTDAHADAGRTGDTHAAAGCLHRYAGGVFHQRRRPPYVCAHAGWDADLLGQRRDTGDGDRFHSAKDDKQREQPRLRAYQ